MLATKTREYTVAEYAALPEGPPYFQLIDSELVMTPPPLPEHQDFVENIYLELGLYFRLRGGGRAYLAPRDIHFNDRNIFEPDLFIILSANSSRMERDGYHGVPDIVIEVLSRSTARDDIGRKKRTYEASGVKEYWIADPVDQTIECLQNSEEGFRLVSISRREDVFVSALLEGFSVSVGSLFTRE